MTTAEEILAHRRARANERQKAYYAKNKGRILADLRSSRVLLAPRPLRPLSTSTNTTTTTRPTTSPPPPRAAPPRPQNA